MKKTILWSEALENRQLLAPCSTVLTGHQSDLTCDKVTLDFPNSNLTVLARGTTSITTSGVDMGFEIVTDGPGRFSADLFGKLILKSDANGLAISDFKVSCKGDIPLDNTGHHRFSDFTTSEVLSRFPSLKNTDVVLVGMPFFNIVAKVDTLLTQATIRLGWGSIGWALCQDAFVRHGSNNTVDINPVIIESTAANPGIPVYTELGRVDFQIQGSTIPTINCPVINSKQLSEQARGTWANTFNSP